MSELKEVFVRDKHIDETKQSVDILKQYDSETQILMAPKSRETDVRGPYPGGCSRLIFMDSESCDDLKNFGVREFPLSVDISGTKPPDRNDGCDFMRRILFKTSESSTPAIKERVQVTFSETGVNENIACLSETSITESIPIRRIRKFSQRLSYVKERPSSNNPTLLALSENVIRLSNNHEVLVSGVDDEVQHDWELDEDSNLMQILKPVIKSVKEKRGISQTSTSDTLNEVEDCDSDSSLRNEESCCEFLSPVAVAKLFITDTLNNAKEAYRHIISQYGDPDKWSMYTASKPPKLSSRWPQIQNFTRESGLYSIEKYIVSCSKLREDWKYTIFFEDMKEDNVSDHYYYEVIFGLPNRLYPIAQVTASLYFHVEVSRIIPPECPVKVAFNTEISGYQIDPENYTLKDNVLLRILDMKLLYFKRIYF